MRSYASSWLRWWCAHKIAFSDFDTTLADNVVSRRGVKVKIRQAVSQQKTLTGELPCLPAWEGNADVLSLRAVDLVLFDVFEIIDSFGDPVFQLGDRGLIVRKLQKLFAGQAARRVGGMIGRRPDLPRQIEHVGR